MGKLLLTGFVPFLDNPINPTAEIVSELDGKKMNGFDIIGVTLPVDFRKAGLQIIGYIEKYKPDTVISLGLAAGRNCVTPERIAINYNDGPADNNGYMPNGEKIFPDGPDGYFSTLPINDMVTNLVKAKLPAKVSNTAGTYVCNNVMYHVLHYFKQENLKRQAGFIHIPASHELALQKRMPSWSQENLSDAVNIAISCLSQVNGQFD